MKKLLLVMTLFSVSSFAQTTTGTVQQIGPLWYYNFTTQPTPTIEVYRPLQVPLVDTFRPFNQAIQNYGWSLQSKRALDLEQQRIKAESDAQRSFNEVLRMIYQPAPAPTKEKRIDSDCAENLSDLPAYQRMNVEQQIKLMVSVCAE